MTGISGWCVFSSCNRKYLKLMKMDISVFEFKLFICNTHFELLEFYLFFCVCMQFFQEFLIWQVRGKLVCNSLLVLGHLFFNIGTILAILREFGKTPDMKDRLTICVRGDEI